MKKFFLVIGLMFSIMIVGIVGCAAIGALSYSSVSRTASERASYYLTEEQIEGYIDHIECNEDENGHYAIRVILARGVPWYGMGREKRVQVAKYCVAKCLEEAEANGWRSYSIVGMRYNESLAFTQWRTFDGDGIPEREF